MPSNLKVIHVRASDSISSLLHHKASLSGLSLSQFLIEKALSDGLSFDSQLRHFIQRIAFESFIIREELPNFAKSIHSLSKLLSGDANSACDPGDANVANNELKPPFNDVLKSYKPTLAHLANQPTSISPGSPSSPSSPHSSSPHSSSPHTSSTSLSSVKLQQLLQQLPLLFDKLAFSTEFLITLFGNIKRYPDVLTNLHSICQRNPHVLSASLLFDFSPSTTSKTSDSFNNPFTASATHSHYATYSHLPNFAFLTLVPSSWAFSSASLLKSKPLGSDLSLVKSQAYTLSLGHPYSLHL